MKVIMENVNGSHDGLFKISWSLGNLNIQRFIQEQIERGFMGLNCAGVDSVVVQLDLDKHAKSYVVNSVKGSLTETELNQKGIDLFADAVRQEAARRETAAKPSIALRVRCEPSAFSDTRRMFAQFHHEREIIELEIDSGTVKDPYLYDMDVLGNVTLMVTPAECNRLFDLALAGMKAPMSPADLANYGGDTVVCAPSEGTKHDGGKDNFTLLAWDALARTQKVLDFGADKYHPRNWEKGIAYTRCANAALRHITAWLDGQEFDAESGLSHLDHASCCIMFLQAYEARGMKEFDDRPAASGRFAGMSRPARNDADNA